MTLDRTGEVGSELQAYEERFLFLLLLLRQPQRRQLLGQLAQLAAADASADTMRQGRAGPS